MLFEVGKGSAATTTSIYMHLENVTIPTSAILVSPNTKVMCMVKSIKFQCIYATSTWLALSHDHILVLLFFSSVLYIADHKLNNSVPSHPNINIHTVLVAIIIRDEASNSAT